MKKDNYILTNGQLLDFVIHFFDDISFHKNHKYHSKTYTFTKVAYETTIKIKDQFSSNSIKILFINDNISSLELTWSYNIFKKKTFQLLTLKTKEEYESFNKSDIRSRIKKISEIIKAKIENIKNEIK